MDSELGHCSGQVRCSSPAVSTAALRADDTARCDAGGDTFSPIPFSKGEELSCCLGARRKEDPVCSRLSLRAFWRSELHSNHKNSRKSTFRFLGCGRNLHHLPNCSVDSVRRKLRNVALESSLVKYLWV